MTYDREESKLAIISVGSILILVALVFLGITGVLYSGMDKRYKAINTRIDSMQAGITTLHVFNFEKNQMDVYVAAGITETTTEGVVIPVYVTQSFFEKGINKIRQRSVELVEQNKLSEEVSPTN